MQGMKDRDGRGKGGGEEKHKSVILSNTGKDCLQVGSCCPTFTQTKHTKYPVFWGRWPSHWQTEQGEATFAAPHPATGLPRLDGSPVSSEPGEGGLKGSIPSFHRLLTTLHAQEATDKKEIQCPKYNFSPCGILVSSSARV